MQIEKHSIYNKTLNNVFMQFLCFFLLNIRCFSSIECFLFIFWCFSLFFMFLVFLWAWQQQYWLTWDIMLQHKILHSMKNCLKTSENIQIENKCNECTYFILWFMLVFRSCKKKKTERILSNDRWLESLLGSWFKIKCTSSY